MSDSATSEAYWKFALRAALVVGGVYTVFMIARHLLSTPLISGDLFYIGGMSFATCAIPAFFAVWVVLGLFGEKLLSSTSE